MGPVIRLQQLWPLALLLIPLCILLWKRRELGFKPPAERAAILLRAVAVISLLLALAGPQIQSHVDAHYVYFLVDRSASAQTATSEAEVARRLTEWAAPRPNTHYGLIVFGKRAYVEVPITAALRINELQTQVDPVGTDLAAALELALASFPEDGTKTIALLSDGRATQGDVARALARARREGVAIYTLPVGAPKHETSVQALRMPREVAADLPFTFETVIHASAPTSARLLVYRDEQLVSDGELALHTGLNFVERRDELRGPGVHEYRVELIAAEDTLAANNRHRALVEATGEPRLLVVEAEETSAPSSLTQILAQAGYAYERVSLRTFAPTLASLLSYRAIVFNDVPLRALTDRQIDHLERYVRDLGGGFWLLQGRRAVEAFYEREFERLLPLTYEGPEEIRKPALALIMILDRSGSMGELAGRAQKIDLLKQAAMAAVAKLDARSLVGIIGFDSDYDWLVPIGPVGQRQEEILRAIDGLSPNGGTDVYPALADAAEELADVEARVRHVLVFSDGKFAREGRNFERLFREIEGSPITASSIAIGYQADIELLWRLAEVGAGEKYAVEDARDLTEITLEELVRLQRARWIKGPVPVGAGPFAYEFPELDPAAIPPVDGYVLTFEKPAAKTALTVGTEDGPRDPLLTSWRYGLGKVTVLNTSLSGEGRERWLGWEGLSGWVAELLGRIYSEAPLQPGEIALEKRLEGSALTVIVEAERDGRWLDGLALEGRLTAAEQEPRALEFAQIGPGRYRARVNDLREGVYLLSVGGEGLGRVKDVVSIPYAEEYRRIGIDQERLGRIASATGGAYLENLDDLGRLLKGKALTYRKVWPHLVLASLLFFLADLVLRKLPLRRPSP